jgi:hypothetical protein
LGSPVQRKARLEEEARNYQLQLEREERERQRQLGQGRIDRLLDEAASLRRASDIRAYVDAMNVTFERHHGDRLGRDRALVKMGACRSRSDRSGQNGAFSRRHAGDDDAK